MGLVHKTTNVFIKVRGSGRLHKNRACANHFLLRWETSDGDRRHTVNKSNKKVSEGDYVFEEQLCNNHHSLLNYLLILVRYHKKKKKKKEKKCVIHIIMPIKE